MDRITSRAVIGMYYENLSLSTGALWLDRISNLFNSDQASEEYVWLGMPPALREWIGGRQAKGLIENGLTIANKHFEATLEILLRDMRRDKTGQLEARIKEFAERSSTHFASLLSTLIVNGASQVCYDGAYFFDTAHSEGQSGTQSNKITTSLAAQPASVHGTVANPSPEEFQGAVYNSINQLVSLVDDQGEPINETASSFLIMVPVGLSKVANSAMTVKREAGTATVDLSNFSIDIAVNPRLTRAGWTDKFVTFRQDGAIKPLIRQQETAPGIKVKDENSEFAFDNDAIQIGIDTWRNAGYGRWQGAVLNTLVS